MDDGDLTPKVVLVSERDMMTGHLAAIVQAHSCSVGKHMI